MRRGGEREMNEEGGGREGKGNRDMRRRVREGERGEEEEEKRDEEEGKRGGGEVKGKRGRERVRGEREGQRNQRGREMEKAIFLYHVSSDWCFRRSNSETLVEDADPISESGAMPQ